MRIFGWVFASFIIMLFQTGVLEPLGIHPVNLILVLMLLALLSGKVQASLTVAIAGGLILDFLTAVPDGYITFSLLLVWGLLHLLFEVFIKRELNVWIFIVSVIGGSWVYAISLVMVSWGYSWFNLGSVFNWSAFILDHLVIAVLYNLLFSWLIWKYIAGIEFLINYFKR
jgi:hypothetical protein